MARHQKSYFRFSPAEFAADGAIGAMTTTEVGCYILLLCKAWHESPPCTIPTDDRTLSRWARVAPDEWVSMRASVLLPFRPYGESRLVHPGLKAEYDRSARTSSRCAAAATPLRGVPAKCLSGRYIDLGSGSSSGKGESEGETRSAGIEQAFAEFWNTYPRRVGKRDAHKAFASAARLCPPEVLLDAADEFAAAVRATGQDLSFVAHPATWLNAERWRDDRVEWWERDAAKQAKWRAEKAALGWWMALTDEDRKARVEAMMAKVRERAITDPIRQAWESRYARGEQTPFAVHEHKQEGGK